MLTHTKTFTLVQREDFSTAENGWCVNELPELDDVSMTTDPYVIAHDLIEHVNGIDEIGGIGEELQAMGGIWNTRGRWPDMRRDGVGSMHTAHDMLANDIGQMWRDHVCGEEFECVTPEMVECGYEEDFAEIIELAEEVARGEIDADQMDEERFQYFKDGVLPFMSMGIRKHEKLYGEDMMANSLFYQVVDSLADPFKWADEYDEIELTINYDEWEVIANIKEPEYDDEFENEYVEDEELELVGPSPYPYGAYES